MYTSRFSFHVKPYQARIAVYKKLGDLDAAERDYAEVVRWETNWHSYWMRATFFEEVRKDLPKAIADYTTAIQLAEREKHVNPEMLYRSRGKLYERLGESEKAAADFERAK